MTDWFEKSAALFGDEQLHIVDALESFEPTARFHRDRWTRPENTEGPILGGHGLSCVLEGGDIFERQA